MNNKEVTLVSLSGWKAWAFLAAIAALFFFAGYAAAS